MYLLGFLISLIGLIFLIVNTILFTTNNVVRQKVSKVFITYLITLSIIEVTCHVIGYLKPNTNFFISHFYFNFQFLFLSYLFFTLFKENKIKRVIATIFFIIFSIVATTYIYNPDLFWQFNDVEIIATSSFLAILALSFILKNLEKVHDYFNFSIGLIMYLLCSISIFLSGNTDLVFVEKPYIDIWVLNALFYILFQYMIYKEYLFMKSKKANY